MASAARDHPAASSPHRDAHDPGACGARATQSARTHTSVTRTCPSTSSTFEPVGHGARRGTVISPYEVVFGGMAIELDCDSCEFEATVPTERAAYEAARQHEASHPEHFVMTYHDD